MNTADWQALFKNVFAPSTLRGAAVVGSAFGMQVDEPMVQTASMVGMGLYGLWRNLAK